MAVSKRALVTPLVGKTPESIPNNVNIDLDRAAVMLREASHLRAEIARLAFDLDGINKSIAYLANALQAMAATVNANADSNANKEKELIPQC